LLGKYNGASGGRSFAIWLKWQAEGQVVLVFVKGYNNGTSRETSSASSYILAGRWYHLGCTYDDGTKAVRMRLWDDTAQTVVETTGTQAQAIYLSTEPLYVGALQSSSVQYHEFDGLLDEMVLFNDILTADEIDAIRAGTYGNAAWAATSSITANATRIHAASMTWVGVSTVTIMTLQWRGAYVPAATLLDPYPIPMLWQYAQRGLNPADPFQQGVLEWSKQISQWCEEHMSRVYREVSRMTTEKANDWVSV